MKTKMGEVGVEEEENCPTNGLLSRQGQQRMMQPGIPYLTADDREHAA
jgi:hypothetical protein